MARRKKPGISIDGNLLQQAIREQGFSIGRLARRPEIDSSEYLLRTAIKDNVMEENLLQALCAVLNLRPEQFAAASLRTDPVSDDPGTLKNYFAKWCGSILPVFGVKEEEYHALADESKAQLQQDLYSSVAGVMDRYFHTSPRETAVELNGIDMEAWLNDYHEEPKPERPQAVPDRDDTGYEIWPYSMLES